VGRYDWVLGLQPGVSVDGFCQTVECLARGHTDGVPFVSVEVADSSLNRFLESHAWEVSFAEPTIPVYVPDDMVGDLSHGEPDHSQLWHLDRVGKSRTPFTGRGTHIYVMDTGIRTTHETFGGRAIPTVDALAANQDGGLVECRKDDTACAADYHGHGTHTAGTAGGELFGVAPKAALHAMRVCCGKGTNVLAGMDWVVEHAQRPAVMTVSLASKGISEASRQAVDRVVNAGVVVTVGAANDNVDTCGVTYGFIPSAITVGATDSSNRRAEFSNWGSCNDIYAPGVGIISAWNDADDVMRMANGTSMATPLVAGAAALLLEQDPTRSPAKILRELHRRSRQGIITGLQPGDPDRLLMVE